MSNEKYSQPLTYFKSRKHKGKNFFIINKISFVHIVKLLIFDKVILSMKEQKIAC